MSDPSIFESRASRTGDAKYPNLVVIIPTHLRKQFNINPGDVVKLKFMGKSEGLTYPVVADFPMSVQIKRIKKLLDGHTKDLTVSNEIITRTISNSLYLCKTLTKRQKDHTLLKSIIAASLYIAARQEKYKMTQKVISDIFDITEPTLRKRYKGGWTDNLEKKHAVDDIIIGKRLWHEDALQSSSRTQTE